MAAQRRTTRPSRGTDAGSDAGSPTSTGDGDAQPQPPVPDPPTKEWVSRAVVRLIDAGNSAYCARCDELLKFRARVRGEQIICNVYVDGKWDRVEHYHPECYKKERSPYGKPAR